MPVLAVLLTALFLLAPHQAFASTLTMGNVVCNIFDNMRPFGKFCEWTAYIAGCALVVQGIHHFRLHADSPSNNPLVRPIMLWFGAMCLLALPNVIYAIVFSIYGQVDGGGYPACNPNGGGGGNGLTLDVMLTNFINNIQGPMISAVSLLAIVCGAFMVVRGLMKASKYGFDPRTHSVNSILANIVFGAIMITIGDNLNVMVASVFGSGTGVTDPSSISWSFISTLGGDQTDFQNAVAAALHFVQLIGVIAFVRGWLIMKKVVEGGGQATMAQGITHILGGVLAINIAAFIQILDYTMGTNLLG